MLKGFTRRFEPLKILTEEQVEDLHQATLDVLRETGVRFDDDWALDFFEKNGCEVDRIKKMVRFPESLVEESLRRCPSTYQFKARDPKNDLTVGGDTVYFKNSFGMQTIDLDTHEPRTPTKSEFIEDTKVLDALPNVHFSTGFQYYGFEGVPSIMALPEEIALRMKYSSKALGAGYSNDCEIFVIKMAQALGIEIHGGPAPSPPLTWGADGVMLTRRWVEAGFPVNIEEGIVFGASAPSTYAGSVIASSAQTISMITLIQLLNPGHRVLAYHFTCPANMTSGAPAFGEIGSSLDNVIFNQLWRRYRIPICNESTGYTNDKVLGYQSGSQKSIGATLAAISGANIVGLQGGVCNALSAHPVQAILDDDVAGAIGRFVEGEEISEETMAVDLIREVGPAPAHYMNRAHTRKWWKTEQFVPKVTDRLTYPEWIKAGKKNAIDYAKDRMKELLATYEEKPLTEDQNREIDEILKEARNYYKDKGLI